MNDKEHRTYIAIDLKSFYASVECMERQLNPLTTNLVVADSSRTDKTICLAVSPSLKAWGIPGRPRLFEVVQKVSEVNRRRLSDSIKKCTAAKNGSGKYVFTGYSFDDDALKKNLSLGVSYITAPPRMKLYMDYSSKIYGIYLKYIAPEDIHVYSIDEVFIDATPYLKLYGMDAHQLAITMIREILYTTGITATAGIGTNLYLAKVAMDIVAKHTEPDGDGVRIAFLDEMEYRRLLWSHTPITDFWRVGPGYAKRLQSVGLYTMGDIARCSVGSEDSFHNERLLYKLFGINAELLIDHAWGWEPATIAAIKAYKPENNSIGSGQVLSTPYSYKKAKIIVKEMTDLLVLDLVDKGLVTDQMVLGISYDKDSLSSIGAQDYKGDIVTDRYGRKIPKHSHGSINLGLYTSSTKLIMGKMTELYEKVVNPKLLIRKVFITANHVIYEKMIPQNSQSEQLDLFTDYNALEAERLKRSQQLIQEKNLQKAVLSIKKRYGKNAILKGINFEDGATTIQRNRQVGGHNA